MNLNLSQKIIKIYEMSSLAKKELESILEDIIQQQKDKLVNNLSKELIKTAESEILLIKKENITNPISWNAKNSHKRINLIGGIIDKGTATGSYTINPNEVKLAKNYEENTLKIATKAAEEILLEFKGKIISKLSDVLLKSAHPKINVINSSVNFGTLEATLKFEFTKSRFTIKTQAVSVWQTTKPFTRFPLTFHDVVLPNGEKLKNPSESKIKKIEIWE